MSPIILYDKQSMLNPKRIELEGAGKLLNLICTASIISQSTSFTVSISSLMTTWYLDIRICLHLVFPSITSEGVVIYQ